MEQSTVDPPEAGEGDTNIPINGVLADSELPENQLTGSPYTAAMGTPEINHDGELFTPEAGEGDTTIPINDILDDPELLENPGYR